MKTLVAVLLLSAVCFGQPAIPAVKHGYGSPEGVIAGVIGDIYQRQDGGAGTTFYVKQSNSGFNFGWVAYASSGSPGGSDGNIQANISGAFGAAKQDLIDAPAFCSDAGSTDAYACTLAPAITAYVTGTHYRFKAATANTGAATINFNGLGAKTIVKVAGGITTALADNDIRAGQWPDVVYDGTNMQMQSTLGNAAVSVTCPAGSAGYIQFYISAGLCGGDSNLTWDNTTKTLAVGPTLLSATSGLLLPLTISTSGPVTVTASGFYFNNASGALTYNLPAITSGNIGLQFCFRNYVTRTAAITLQLPASTLMDLGGTNGSSAGTLVSDGALGDSVCAVATSTTQYVADVRHGAWTNN